MFEASWWVFEGRHQELERVMDATCARLQVSKVGVRELSLWQKFTEYAYRPWHCSTAIIQRRLDARESHAQGLAYQEHFLVQIWDLTKNDEWNIKRGTAYVQVSRWLYRNHENCKWLTVKYRTSRYLSPEELREGRGIKAKLATWGCEIRLTR